MTDTMTVPFERVNQPGSVAWRPSTTEPVTFRVAANMAALAHAEPGGTPGVPVGQRPVVLGSYWLAGGEIINPVRALVEQGSAFVATEAQTGLFGVGPTFAAAVNDLRAALVEHLEVLSADDALADDLRRQLAFLRSHLRH